MENDGIINCQKVWLDKLAVFSKKPLLVKAIEGKLPKELLGTNAEGLYRWSYYKDVWLLVRTPIFTRGILPNEIVFDPDTQIWDDLKREFEKIVSTCKRLNIPYLLAYSGGKGCHLHIFFDHFSVTIPEELFEKAKENKYDIFRAFRQYIFEYVVRESGANLELLKIDKPKVNWQIFSMGSQVRDFGTMRPGGFCKTLIHDIPVVRPTAPLPLEFPVAAEMWKIPPEHVSNIINIIKVGIVHQNKWNKQELPPIQGLKIEDIPCISNIMRGLDSGRYYGAGAIALVGKSMKYTWEQVEPLIETFLNRCKGLSQSDITLRLDNSHQLFLSDHEFSCKWIKENLKCVNPSECIITINRKEQREKDEKIDFTGVAEGLLSVNNFLTIAETDELYYYHEGVYIPFGEVYVKSEVQKQYQDLTTHDYNEVINYIKRKSYVPLKEVNNNHQYIAMQNGVFNLNTYQLEPFDPKHHIITKIPVKYDPAAKCPEIEKFLKDTLAPGDIPAIEEFIGYCLLRDYPIQKAFMLVGSGRNGKSTLLRLLKAFIGNDNVSSIAVQELEENHFAGANLMGKLANIYADLPAKSLATTGTLKMLTGGDNITAEKKFGGFVSFVNYAKMIFSTNQMPETYDDTDAFYRRWVIINFPNTFEEKPDARIDERLKSESELSGLLNIAIVGLKRLLENGRFSNHKQIEEIRDQYVRLSNPTQAFIWDCIDFQYDGWVEKKKLYQIFAWYCKQKNITLSSEKKFFLQMQILTKAEDYRTTDDNNNRVRALRGIVPKIDFLTLYDKGVIVHTTHDVHDSSLCANIWSNNDKSYNFSVQQHYGENHGYNGHSGLLEHSVTELKQKYDSFCKPESPQELARIKHTMESHLWISLNGETENEDVEAIETTLKKVVSDYCHARGWE